MTPVTVGLEWKIVIRKINYSDFGKTTNETAMAVTHPTLAKFFHPTKNEEWTTENLKAGTGKILWWRCENGHEWQQRGYAMLKVKGQICPTCRKQTRC